MHNLSTIVGKSEDHYGVLCRVPEKDDQGFQ